MTATSHIDAHDADQTLSARDLGERFDCQRVFMCMYARRKQTSTAQRARCAESCSRSICSAGTGMTLKAPAICLERGCSAFTVGRLACIHTLVTSGRLARLTSFFRDRAGHGAAAARPGAHWTAAISRCRSEHASSVRKGGARVVRIIIMRKS